MFEGRYKAIKELESEPLRQTLKSTPENEDRYLEGPHRLLSLPGYLSRCFLLLDEPLPPLPSLGNVTYAPHPTRAHPLAACL